jgi:hypothetical protein
MRKFPFRDNQRTPSEWNSLKVVELVDFSLKLIFDNEVHRLLCPYFLYSW